MTVTEAHPAGVAEPRDSRTLVPAPVFDALVEDLRRHHHVTKEYAERTVGQALVFLKAQAGIVRARREGRPWTRIVPTVPVDTAGHCFILRTRDYAAFCDEHAGEYIHHVPFQGRSHAVQLVPGEQSSSLIAVQCRGGAGLRWMIELREGRDCRVCVGDLGVLAVELEDPPGGGGERQHQQGHRGWAAGTPRGGRRTSGRCGSG